MREGQDAPACPVATMLGLIDSKWKVFVLRNLLQGPNRFSDLKRTIPGISSKALSEALRSMEADGLLVKEVGEGPNPPVTYRLSDLGESMRPVIEAMRDWGQRYLDGELRSRGPDGRALRRGSRLESKRHPSDERHRFRMKTASFE